MKSLTCGQIQVFQVALDNSILDEIGWDVVWTLGVTPPLRPRPFCIDVVNSLVTLNPFFFFLCDKNCSSLLLNSATATTCMDVQLGQLCEQQNSPPFRGVTKCGTLPQNHACFCVCPGDCSFWAFSQITCKQLSGTLTFSDALSTETDRVLAELNFGEGECAIVLGSERHTDCTCERFQVFVLFTQLVFPPPQWLPVQLHAAAH